jgi:hypothetical protein
MLAYTLLLEESRGLARCNHDLRTTTLAQANQELTNRGAMDSSIEAEEDFLFVNEASSWLIFLSYT